jgi:hypothetical protein
MEEAFLLVVVQIHLDNPYTGEGRCPIDGVLAFCVRGFLIWQVIAEAESVL